MRKKGKTISDIFVKKITERGKKFFTKSDIEKIWIRSGGSASRLNFALTLLKNQQLLIRIARGFYFVGEHCDLDEFYWEIIDSFVGEYVEGGVVIGGEKSLEWKIFNRMPPQKLIVYTRDFSARIRLFDGREVHFRTLVSGSRTQKINLFPILKTFSYREKGYKNLFFPMNELALLEALSYSEKNIGNNDMLILQFLQRRGNQLDKDIFLQIVRYGYIFSINRLRFIAKEQKMESLYNDILFVIKKEGGGCFISV